MGDRVKDIHIQRDMAKIKLSLQYAIYVYIQCLKTPVVAHQLAWACFKTSTLVYNISDIRLQKIYFFYIYIVYKSVCVCMYTYFCVYGIVKGTGLNTNISLTESFLKNTQFILIAKSKCHFSMFRRLHQIVQYSHTHNTII